MDAARPYLDSGVITSIRLSTRPDAIDSETLSRLQFHGVKTVELGAQSMDDGVLRLSGRGHTAADVKNAAQMVKAAGFRLILQMMTGLPGDTDEKDIATAKEIIALTPDGVRIYPTVIVKDTALYEMWRAGKYGEHSVEDAVCVCARLVPLFSAAGIPIIRLGLNPTDVLSSGDAVGGAYHPALGELVHARVMLNKARKLLAEVAPGVAVTLGVNKSDVSKMIGQHRQNIEALRSAFSLADVCVKPADVKKNEIILLDVEKPRQM